MDGDLAPGGNVVLSGEGSWNLGEMCVEWDDKVEKYFSIFLELFNFFLTGCQFVDL